MLTLAKPARVPWNRLRHSSKVDLSHFSHALDKGPVEVTMFCSPGAFDLDFVFPSHTVWTIVLGKDRRQGS